MDLFTHLFRLDCFFTLNILVSLTESGFRGSEKYDGSHKLQTTRSKSLMSIRFLHLKAP